MFLFEDWDKNIWDVVIYLYEWYKMVLDWYEVGMGGKKVLMLVEGYMWKMILELNLVIW